MGMTTDRVKRIREALSNAGLGWLFTDEADEREYGLAEEFDEAEAFYNVRYKGKLGLLEKVESNPNLYKPFLQSIGLPVSTEMRIIIARISEGMEIKAMDFKYRNNGNSALSVELSEEPENAPIVAIGPWDALLLPQLGYFVNEDKLNLGGICPWKALKE